jgi:Xaa-Pro aminopeptidase
MSAPTVPNMVDRSTFPAIDHRARVERVQSTLRSQRGHGCDAYLYTDLVDLRWLTGFSGSNGWAVVTADDLIVGTDGRYGERALAETAGTGAAVIAETSRVRLHERLVESLAATELVGLDPSSITQSSWTALTSDITLHPLGSIVADLRQVKDDGELARIAAAAAAADAALADVEPLLFATVDRPVSEADIRNELEYRMRLHGADDRSYETIVAAGPDHAARPHHEPTIRPIVEGDTVIIDVGALVDGYHSDMTRSYVIGEPTALQRELYELVSRSHRAGIDAIPAAVEADARGARVVDASSRDVFEAAGYGDWYLHGTGHGVGLQIHERPFHSLASDDAIRVGNVVTVEPGLYRVGFGGFRIEDLLVVTEQGSRRLTHAPERPFS